MKLNTRSTQDIHDNIQALLRKNDNSVLAYAGLLGTTEALLCIALRYCPDDVVQQIHSTYQKKLDN